MNQNNSSHPLPIKETLQNLMRTKSVKSGSALARQLNLPPPTINRLLSGQVLDPRASTLSLLADFFMVSVDQLLGKTPLDLPCQTTISASSTDPILDNYIPLVDLSTSTIDINQALQQPKQWTQWRSKNPNIHCNVFAIKIKDKKLEPIFSKGTTLYVEPVLKPMDADYVAVILDTNPFISIKKYIIDGKEHYFYPLHSGRKIYATQDIQYQLLGVILEARMNLKEMSC